MAVMHINNKNKELPWIAQLIQPMLRSGTLWYWHQNNDAYLKKKTAFHNQRFQQATSVMGTIHN